MPETKSKIKTKSVETDDIMDNEAPVEVSKAEELAGMIIESARHMHIWLRRKHLFMKLLRH